MFGLPKHKNCRNCGDCCNTVPMTKRELDIIKDYVNSLPADRRNYLWQHIKDNKAPKCPFRDDIDRKCAVYPARPLICQVFGIIGVGDECKYGNSYKLFIKEMMTSEFLDTDRYLVTGVNWAETEDEKEAAEKSKAANHNKKHRRG